MKRNKTIRILLSLIVLMTTGGVSRVCAETIDNVTYVDANGQSQTANDVIVLDGTETTLGAANTETWYVAQGTLNYTSALTLNGTVHLILADNAVMTVGAVNDPIVGSSAISANGAFTIYSQGCGTTEGKLIATCSNDPNDTQSHTYGIFAKGDLTINGGIIKTTGGDDGIQIYKTGNNALTLTINGGDITAVGTLCSGFYGYVEVNVVINGGKFEASGNTNTNNSTFGIFAHGNITINGGKVNAIGTSNGIVSRHLQSGGDIAINGGQVTAANTYNSTTNYGIWANGVITLGWTNPDDYIYANSYKNSVKTADGNSFIAYTALDGLAASDIINGGNTHLSASKINGKYLRPRVAGNLLQVDAAKGITASGYKRAYDINTTHYYIYESGDEVTLNLPNYGQDGVDLTIGGNTTSADVTIADNAATASYTMPASDVTITDAKYYNVNVPYMEWNGPQKKLVSATTDANTKVYILEGTHDATTLDGGWYFVKNTNTDANVNEGIDANYTGRLTFSGEAHLILADGSDMNINYNSSNNASNYGIQSNNNFYIHRQGDGEGTGKLTIRKSGDGLGISLGGTSADFVMTGGILDVKSPGTCIATSNGNINIYGGKVTAKSYKLVGEEEQISDYYAFNANGAINILGGQVEAYGGGGDDKIAINAKAGDLTLGWTNPEDYIKASSYKALTGYNVKTAIGKRFVAYDAETGVAANASSLSLGSATSTQATEIPNTISLTDAAAENTIAGKTLRPLDGYYVKDEAGLTFNGKTNADGSAKPDFTITTDAGTVNEVTTPYYIYKANTDQNPVSVVVNSTGHADDHMEISATTATAAITQSDAEASSHCFAMPAADVIITGIKYYTYGVDYIDPTAAANEQAKTTPANTKVYILDGSETTLGTDNTETWHVAQGALNYSGRLLLKGNVHLILANNAEMSVKNENSNTYAILHYGNSSDNSFTIYGQSVGTGETNGSLSVESTGDAIRVQKGDITINGGSVTTINTGNGSGLYASPASYNPTKGGIITINGGIFSSNPTYGMTSSSSIFADYGGSIVINGGTVNATGALQSLFIKRKLDSTNGDHIGSITINGGKVTATCLNNNNYGIYAYEGDIILNWANEEDFIFTNRYTVLNGYKVKIAAGKRFVAYDAKTGAAANASSLSLGSATSTQATEIPNTISLTDAAAENTIAGKTLRPLDGYYVKDEAGLTFNGKTNADGSAKPDFTITNGTITTPYYIYKENATVTVASTGHDTDYMEINADFDLNQTEEQALAHSFQMLDKDIILQNVKYYNLKVPYLTWDDTKKKLVKTTTDANTKVYILEGTHDATTLDGGWYVVQNTNTDANVNSGIDAEYTEKLTLNGDVNLILSDNAAMKVTSSTDNAILSQSRAFAIYGQGGIDNDGKSIEGKLTTDANRYALSISNAPLTINGGIIDFSSTEGGIYAHASSNETTSVTINGGQLIAKEKRETKYNAGINVKGEFTMNNGYVDVSENKFGIRCDKDIVINDGKIDAKDCSNNAIYSTQENVTINGGQVTASSIYTTLAGIRADEDITLGWTNPTDYIEVSSYYNYSGNNKIIIAQGKYFSTSDASYGSKDADYVIADVSDINGKKLMPTVAVQTGNAAFLDMCSTDGCYKVMGNAKAFPVVGYDITHKTVKLGAALAGVPNGVPVVICMVDGEGNPTDAALGADVMLVCATGQDAIDIQNSVATEGGNMPSALFFAGDANKTWEQLLEAAMQSLYPTADATQLASLMSERMFLELANGRFRPVAVNLANTSKLGKALLTITKYDFLKMIKAPATAAPGFHGIAIELGEETEVHEMADVRSKMEDVWYTLEGRKLDKAPTQKGIYINGGHKVVVK